MNDTQTKTQQRNIVKTVGLLMLAIAVIMGLFVNRWLTPAPVSDAELYTLGAKVFDVPRRFTHVPLLDQNGDNFDYQRLQNTWSLVFFGFTYCPDVCPATLAQMRSMHNQLEPELQATTQVVLVSVDPARDTPEKLKEYLTYFSEDFVGLTGEFLDLQRFASQLNAAFQKVPGGGENYLIDHSAQIMLINPKGDYHGFIKPPFTPEKLAQAYTGVRTNFELQYPED